jgi:hypothetical protein
LCQPVVQQVTHDGFTMLIENGLAKAWDPLQNRRPQKQ